MKCNHCGAEIADDSIFCEHCGKKIEATAPAKPSNKKNIRNIGLIAAGVVVVAVLAVLLWPKSGGKTDAEGYQTNLYPVVNENGKYGYIDKDGNIVIPFMYSLATPFSEGIARVKMGTGEDAPIICIDEKGQQLFSGKYEYMGKFSEGLAIVIVGGDYGFIDKKGNLVIPCQYDFAHDYDLFESDRIAVRKKSADGSDSKWGFIDKKGNVVIPFQYDKAYPFSEGLAGVAMGERYGYIDKDGNVAIPFQYNSVRNFSEGLAAAPGENGWGVIDKKGNWVIQPIYSYCGYAYDGIFVVEKDGKEGCLDKKGNIIIPIVYQQVRPAEGGWAAVKVDGKWGFVDMKDYYLIQPKYSRFEEACKDLAIVCEKDNDIQIIDRNGRTIANFTGSYLYGSISGDLIIIEDYHPQDETTGAAAYTKSTYLNKSGKVLYQGKVTHN